MGLIEHRVRAIARVLYMVDGADFDLIVRERADGPTATLVARKIAEALPDVHVPDEAAIERGAKGLHRRDVADPACEPDRREWDHLTVALQDEYRADARAVLRAALGDGDGS